MAPRWAWIGETATSPLRIGCLYGAKQESPADPWNGHKRDNHRVKFVFSVDTHPEPQSGEETTARLQRRRACWGAECLHGAYRPLPLARL